MNTALGALADFAAGLPPRLPAAVAAKARLCLLDALCAMVTAPAHPRVRAAMAAVAPVPQGIFIPGLTLRAGAAEAALLGGVAAAATGRMDTHPAPATHPGTVVVPAVLAAAQHAGASGAETLAALVAGYEAMWRLGEALVTPELSAIHRPTGLCGPLGAAFGAGVALRLSPAQLVNAGSLAVQTAAGLNEWAHAGTAEGAFHSGLAARSGVTAALMAAAGAVAAPTALEGPAGLLSAHGARGRSGLLTEGLGQGFAILGIQHKPAPACIYVQTPCQVAATLGPVAPGDVEAVEVAVCAAAAAYPGCDNPGPITGMQSARMSIQYSVGAVLAAGAIRAALWGEAPEEAGRAIAARTRVVMDDALTAAYPVQGARVTLRLKDGTLRHAAQPALREMGWAEIAALFQEAATPVLGATAAEEALGLVAALEELPRLAGLMEQLTPR